MRFTLTTVPMVRSLAQLGVSFDEGSEETISREASMGGGALSIDKAERSAWSLTALGIASMPESTDGPKEEEEEEEEEEEDCDDDDDDEDEAMLAAIASRKASSSPRPPLNDTAGSASPGEDSADIF